MEKSLAALLITVLILSTGQAAFGQTYYGRAYQGQAQNYGQYYGRPNYQQYYSQPGQNNQYGQVPPNVGYYRNYQDYVSASQYPGYSSATPGLYYPRQAYPNTYNQQPAQPNPYYGVPQYQQQRSYPQTMNPMSSTNPTPRRAIRASAVPASRSNPNDSFSLEEKASQKAEIYWDPRQEEAPSNPGIVSSQAPQMRPIVREQTPAPRPRVVRPRKPERRQVTTAPVKRRSLKWGKDDSKPPTRRAMKWGKEEEPQAPASRTMKWGKDTQPAAVVSEPGSGPGVATRGPSQSTAQVDVQPKETGKSFKWGKNN
jgi:hypothetical protein